MHVYILQYTNLTTAESENQVGSLCFQRPQLTALTQHVDAWQADELE